jgi:hypothetical protein
MNLNQPKGTKRPNKRSKAKQATKVIGGTVKPTKLQVIMSKIDEKKPDLIKKLSALTPEEVEKLPYDQQCLYWLNKGYVILLLAEGRMGKTHTMLQTASLFNNPVLTTFAHVNRIRNLEKIRELGSLIDELSTGVFAGMKFKGMDEKIRRADLLCMDEVGLTMKSNKLAMNFYKYLQDTNLPTIMTGDMHQPINSEMLPTLIAEALTSSRDVNSLDTYNKYVGEGWGDMWNKIKILRIMLN